MQKQKYCIDFYGEKLNIGDEVVPILEEALILNIGGFISKIKYSERYNNHYITITDEKGNILLEGVDARCYTTQERIDEREEENIYNLVFHDERLYYISNIPLTNKTNINFDIPENTSYITLEAKHYGKEKQLDCGSSISYINMMLYYFIIAKDMKVCHEKEERAYYLENSNNGCYQRILKKYKIFKDQEKLKEYIKCIIEYFNNADLTHINNCEEFRHNEIKKEFEKTLTMKLKHRTF